MKWPWSKEKPKPVQEVHWGSVNVHGAEVRLVESNGTKWLDISVHGFTVTVFLTDAQYRKIRGC